MTDNPDITTIPSEEMEPGASRPAAEPSKVRTPRPLSSLVGHLVGGNLISTGIRLVCGVLQGRLVLPATLGLFNGIGLVLRYAPFLQLGILDGLYRELPFHIGRGNRSRAEELAGAAQAWALTVGSLVCLSLMAVAGWQLFRGNLWAAAGWFTNAILAMVFYYKTYYLQLTYRTAHDFSKLALVGVVESVSSLLLLVLVAWFNFYGLCMRALAVGAVGTGLLFLWRPIRVRPRWEFGHLWHLLKIGLPIFCVGQLYAWWSVLNSTLVLKYAGLEGMGLYSMVMMANTTIEFIPSAVNQVIYPRITERYGRTGRVAGLLQIARKPMLWTVLGLVPIILVAEWVLGPVVRWVVPNYVGAIPAMRWALWLPLISCLYPVSSVFQIVRRQDLYGGALVVAMGVYMGVLMYLIRDQVDLRAFPQAMLIGRMVFALLCAGCFSWLRVWERKGEDSNG